MQDKSIADKYKLQFLAGADDGHGVLYSKTKSYFLFILRPIWANYFLYVSASYNGLLLLTNKMRD
jgi:hypothetical protein